MTFPGQIPVETVELCKDFLDFTRCERSDGSAYGTAGKCRLGVESEKVKEVKAALAMSPEEFVEKYGARREARLDEFADSFAEKASKDDGIHLGPKDQIRLLAAEQAERTISRYHRLVETGNPENAEAAASILTAKELFDGVKSRLVSDHMFISEGSLQLLWEGKDPAQKALAGLTPQEIAKYGGPKSFGQSNLIVDEHPYPTKTLKTKLMTELPRGASAVEVGRYALKRNFYSWTSAVEDTKITASGFKSEMPDDGKRFSRYDQSGIKLFSLKVPEKNRSEKGFVSKNWIVKSAKQSRESGVTYEEWVSSVIDL